MGSSLFDLKGKVAIVTGGNGGIGLGIAKGLASTGASVVVAARSQKKTAAALSELRQVGTKILGITIDVSDESSIVAAVERTISHFKQIDILVNNSGVGIRKLPQDHTRSEWESVLETNLTGTFLCARAVYPYMSNAGGGKIINIGSMTSVFGSDVVPSYAASKGGVVQLTKSLAVAWAKDNIQVNTILPGWIHTDMTRSIKTDNPQRYNSIKSRIPQGRWGEPNELAGTAIFLASSASNYITGISLPVDGGYTSS